MITTLNTLNERKQRKEEREMKKQKVAEIRLTAPNGEIMIWKTCATHVEGNKVKYLDVAKASFAHDLVNKKWVEEGKASEVPFEDGFVIVPNADTKVEILRKKVEMKKEVDELKKQITANRIFKIKKDPVKNVWISPYIGEMVYGM